jgi:hypothetical protein
MCYERFASSLFTLCFPMNTLCYPKKSLLVIAAASLFGAGELLAQRDAPPVDLTQLAETLRKLKEQQAQQRRVQQQKVLGQIQEAASNGAAAAAAWEDAVRLVQFEGASREGAQFRAWKDGEGSTLDHKEVQNAARLYFVWLRITLQRATDVPVKNLIPDILSYLQEVNADKAAIAAYVARAKKEKEQAERRDLKRDDREKKESDSIPKMHDRIMKSALSSNPPAQALGVSQSIEIEGWEQVPGNSDAIFTNIVMPALREAKDPRLLDLWDAKIKEEAEIASKAHLAFQADKFNLSRRPELLWSKAEDALLLGQKNRAITDMLSIIKAHPTHPKAKEWLTRLESLVSPAPASPGGSAAAEPAASPAAQ